jgi:hypothetical protein
MTQAGHPNPAGRRRPLTTDPDTVVYKQAGDEPAGHNGV